MFGGAGIFCDGLMFALVADDVLYLKVDGENRAGFEAEALPAFSYQTKIGRTVIASFRRAPDRLLDDADELAVWARASLTAAHRAQQLKPIRKLG